MLDRHRDADGVAHRPHAIGNERRLGHQAGPETPGLHALGRAAAIEIDLVVAPALAKPRSVGELPRVAAAELQRDRVLGRIEIEVPRHVAMGERGRGNHLGVEARMRGNQAQEEPAVPVGPVHHRGHGKAPS